MMYNQLRMTRNYCVRFQNSKTGNIIDIDYGKIYYSNFVILF